MSHTATVQVEFKEHKLLQAAVEEMGGTVEFAAPGQKITKKLYQGSYSGVMAINLPKWKYPIVIDEEGNASYDNYNGSWGKQEVFNEMKQKYSKNVALKKAKRLGFNVKETKNENGTLRLTLTR
jgi:hypothetical protein